MPQVQISPRSRSVSPRRKPRRFPGTTTNVRRPIPGRSVSPTPQHRRTPPASPGKQLQQQTANVVDFVGRMVGIGTNKKPQRKSCSSSAELMWFRHSMASSITLNDFCIVEPQKQQDVCPVNQGMMICPFDGGYVSYSPTAPEPTKCLVRETTAATEATTMSSDSEQSTLSFPAL